MQAMEALMGLEPTAGADTAHDAHADDADEARLIRATLAGDEEAFAALVRRHQGRVFRLAGRFFRQRQDVEEVAQETFLRAWLKLGTYSARAPFEHWLTRLCLRCAYDRLRRPGQGAAESATYTEPRDPLAAPAADPTARLEVQRLLAGLQPADRFLLVLLEAEGWSVAEIAERLGWSRVNVKVRAHRARQRLRRVLEEG
ncbi:MAG TPA: RNA polymerase sigma factor [Thermoanaerobaculia bacterium]|nr:RNA polymerase sigma factor [Thermoanaerobaculia bacterium]